jgi:hypothetical protein
MTVSGFTMIRTERQPDHSWESHIHSRRSARRTMSRFVRSLKHDQLMTKRNDLGLHHSLASKTGEKGTEHH